MPRVLNIDELCVLHDRVSRSYCDVMQEHGLVAHAAEPLIPRSDQTVLFTNATIIALKEVFLRSDYCGGYFLAQDCLRLQRLGAVLDDGYVCRHLSLFKMLGSLVPGDEFNLAVECCLAFLARAGVAMSDLVVLVPANCDATWRTAFAERSISCEATPAYIWGYGLEDTYGVGVAFGCRDSDGAVHSFGNLVAMYNNERLRAVEFGFGLEALTGRALLGGSPFSGSLQLAAGECEESDVTKNIADVLGIALAISSAGVTKRSSRSRWFVFTRSLRCLALLCYRNHLERKTLDRWIEVFNARFFKTPDNAKHLQRRLDPLWVETTTASARFSNWLASQRKLYRTRGIGVLAKKTYADVVRHGEERYFLERSEIETLLKDGLPWTRR